MHKIKDCQKTFHKVEEKLLRLVHSDICELNGLVIREGKIYFITFINDLSRYTYVYLIKIKDETLSKFDKADPKQFV